MYIVVWKNTYKLRHALNLLTSQSTNYKLISSIILSLVSLVCLILVRHLDWCWLTLPDDLMPLMSAAQTSMELSSRQRARCQTTGPVSSRPADRCRATRLQRKTHLKTSVRMLAFHLHRCVFHTPSKARLGSVQMKDKCCFPESRWPPKHHLHYKTLEKQKKKTKTDIKIFFHLHCTAETKLYNHHKKTCAAAVAVSPAEACRPRQRRLEGGEHVIQAVGDDDIIVNGNY